MAKQRLLYAGLGAWAVVAYALLVLGGRAGLWTWSVVAIWLASPLLLYGLRYTVEGSLPKAILNFRSQSWAFLFGDVVFLPFTAAMLALGWHKIDVSDQWFTGWWWLPLTMVVGVISGMIFRKMDGDQYAKLGAERTLHSPSKVAHDFVAYPVLFGGLVHLGFPALTEGSSRGFAFLALIGVGLWAAAGVRDMVAGLDPFKLHPEWDEHEFRPLA